MSELHAVEQNFEKAMISSDTAALGRILHEDLEMITPVGTVMSKAELLGLMDSGMLKFEGLDLQDQIVHDLGTAAAVTGRAHMRASMGDQKFEARTRYTHVYMKEGAAWRMVVAQGTQVSQ